MPRQRHPLGLHQPLQRHLGLEAFDFLFRDAGHQVQRYEKGEAQPTLEMIRKLSKALTVSADRLLFDDDERGPDDSLRLQFEALQQFDDDERATAQAVLEGLILKHQARQSQLRMQPKKKASG
nr:helix-turn-helix transcriptional regulator [Pseudoxanthomonas broegbernensis]